MQLTANRLLAGAYFTLLLMLTGVMSDAGSLMAQAPNEPKGRELHARLFDTTPTFAPMTWVFVFKLEVDTDVSVQRVDADQDHPRLDFNGLSNVWDTASLHFHGQVDANDILIVGRSLANKGGIALLREGAQGFAQVGQLYEEMGYPERFDPDQVPQGLQASTSGSGASKTSTTTKRRSENVFVQNSRYEWLVTKNKGVLLDKKTRTAMRNLLRGKEAAPRAAS